jgi:hypothetical protein
MKTSRIILMANYALNAIDLVGAIYLVDAANGGAFESNAADRLARSPWLNY